MSRRAEDLKSKGNACFKNNEYEKARKHYMDALKAGMEEGTVDIMHTIYGNLAHVNNKLGAYKESEKYARLAIRKKPDWFKGYYRAAVAAQSLGKLDDAIALLEKGIDNCVSNDELKTLRDSYIEKKKKPKGAAKPPPPPPPLLKADPPPAGAAAAAADPPRSALKTRAGKTSKTASKTSSESSGSGVWSSLLAAGRPADTVSEQTAAAARAGDPAALTEELCITVRRGSVALQRPGGAREAYDEYRKALQQVAKHPKELNLSGNELISLRYCFAMACHEVATLEALNSAEDELLAIIQKTKRPMPAAFYLLGLVYMRLNRFSQAASVLQLASDMLGKDARGDTHVYPGTAQTIPDTERAWRGTLRVPVQELLKQCQYPPRPDALCRLGDCQARVTVPDVQNAKRTRQETRRAIYYRDVDFVGFIQVQCLSKCQLEYHLPCWRQLKEHFGPETQRTTDKDLLNTKCLTPDCDSDICRIVTVDANGLEKHEIVSDEYRRRQQKQPQKQLSKQQKKQAAQAAAKKQQVSKSRKHRDSAPQPSEDGDTQKSPSEPAAAAAAAAASATASAASAAPAAEAAAAAASSSAAAREPAPPPAPPDLREMTVLRRGSITDEVPASKKSKKKKKGGSSTRTRGRRPAAEMFWDTADQEEQTYNGPPVIVTYNVSEDDLASRLCQLEDLRTLQFSTRSLIPDTSVQPASVPRDDQSSEEAHAILESAYQFLYDYLKEAGPTPANDPTLLSIASELPSHCQQMIAQYGSLENFLTRLPRFYRLDELLCVEVDVAEAEALLGSAIADRVRAVDTPPPPPLWEQQQQLAELEQQAHHHHQQQQQQQQQDQAQEGLSDAETAELEQHSDQDGADSESEAEMEMDVEDHSAPTQNGSVHTESATADPESESAAADRGHSDSAEVDPDSAEAEPVPDPSEGDADSVAEDPEDSAAEEEEEAADSSERLVRDSGGGGARGDGAWNADPELSDDGQDSLSQSETSANDAELVAQLKQQIETLKQDKVQRDEQLAEARISQLRLERTVRQLTPRGADQQPAAAQQLTEARQQLAETSGRLQQAEQQRGLAARRCSEMSHQLAATQQQLAAAQQELGAAQQEVLMQQQQLAGYQQERDELGAQLAAMHEQARQYEAQLAETQQHAALMEEQAEALASQLSQTPSADPERVRQLERQLDEEEAGRRRAEAALEELRAGERRARGQYVTLLSRAGTERLDIATGRCRDAISSARRAATSSGRPDSAAPTIAVLEEALGTIDGTRAQFKETIKKACKAIASKETIDIQSLKLPEIPDIVDTAINGPGTRRAAPRTSPAASVVGSAASPRPSSRPSSVITVSSGSGSEAGRVSPAAPPPPPPPAPAPAPAPVAQASSGGSAAAPAAAPLRVPRPVTPAAAQLSAVSKQAAPTTFDALVSAIERQFGGAVPGGRDAIIRQVTSYRRRRGGALRGAGRDQIVTEVTAMLRAEAADAAPPASAWGGKANGAQSVAAVAPALTATPSREECLICRESYSRSQARKLDCGHQLHELCLRRWLQANGVMATCPICRHPFTSDTDFPSL